jgi:hypothetical protein
MENSPHYYAIIPATIRYDNRIPANAKLLYGEITALCNKEGYCWAGNAYFADLYQKNERSVINWINALRDAGYITVTFTYVPGTREIARRHIRLAEAEAREVVKISSGGGEKNFTTCGKNLPEVVKNFSGGGEKKCVDINTINNTNNTTTTTTEPEVPKPGDVPVIPEKKPEEAVAAADTIPQNGELKAAFAKIDEKLVFDPEFYGRAAAYLAVSGLDSRYLAWLYDQCELREPRSLAGLYYKLFFAPNMAELFKICHKPKPPPLVETIICPVCGTPHNKRDGECPDCRFSRNSLGVTGEIEQAKRIYALPPDEKAAFRQEMNSLLENPFEDFQNKIKKQREIYQKYGIP